MEHQVIEFFPSVCGVYQYPEDKINDIKLVCQKIRNTIKPGDQNYNQNALNGDLFHYYNTSNTNIYDFHPELEDHRKWVLECATHFFTKVHNYVLSDENELLMTDAWMNYCLERAQQSEHNHHNSLISGTYYVNLVDWVHAPLTFMKREPECHPYIAHAKDWDSPNKYSRYVEDIRPREGDLLLWKSHLIHGYNGNLNMWADRTSISMNFVPRILDNGKYSFVINTRNDG